MTRFEKCGIDDCLGWVCEYHALPEYVKSLLRVARAVSAEPIVIAGQLGQFKTIVYTDELHEALEEVKDIL